MKAAFSTEGFKHLNTLISSLGSISQDGNRWFNHGVDCQLLEPTQPLRKGKIKIKIVLEFESDEVDEIPFIEIKESESCLDDIRQEINQA